MSTDLLVESSVENDSAKQQCDHCDLPVPRSLVDPQADLQFCCGGCRVAYETIHDCGLEAYYDVRNRMAGEQQPAAGKINTYAAYDTEAFQAKHVDQLSSGLCAIELRLKGVHCAACVWLVERLPQMVAGVIEARLSLASSAARLVWDPQQTSLSTVAGTLAKLGYSPHPARDTSAQHLHLIAERERLTKMAIAGALAGNNMLIALALYAGVFDGIELRFALLFRWLSMGIGWVSLAWPGQVFFRNAWAAFAARTVNLDVPISLALGAGAIAGTANVLLNQGEVYFDSLSVLVFLLLVGRFIQARQQRWAQDAIGGVFSLTPDGCHILRAGHLVEESVESLAVNDVVEVRAGELLPADGVVIQGESTLNRSLLTGESLPIAITEGDLVHAGVQNLTATLRVRVQAVGNSTRIGQLLQRVEESLQTKPSIVQFTDRVAGRFVAIVVTLAMLNFTWWVLTTGIAPAIESTVALLIVACPCALGLATPLTMAIAIGRASNQGTLIKTSNVLEILGHRRSATPGRLLLDKTGTLTKGKLQVVAWRGETEIMPYVAAMEAESNHPVAQAITRYCASQGTRPQSITQRQEWHGKGVSAACPQGQLKVGSPRWLAGSDAAAFDYDDIQGLTRVSIAIEHEVVAEVLLSDQLQSDAAESLDQLKRQGWSVHILSGDTPEAVLAVATQLGIAPQRALAQMSPEAKLEFVQAATQDRNAESSATEEGPVVVVGDGVNDAAALAAADVGIAVHGGAEAALAAADVYVSQPGIGAVVGLIRLAKQTMYVVHRNLAISLAYNTLAIALAAGGYVTPLLAALLMPLSSSTVLASAILGLSRSSRSQGHR